jgi:hypothetical protein
MAASGGEVVFVAVNNTEVIVVRHDGGFAVVELVGNEEKISKADRVSGDWSKLGQDSLLFGGRKLSCYYQGSLATLDEAVGMARKVGR